MFQRRMEEGGTHTDYDQLRLKKMDKQPRVPRWACSCVLRGEGRERVTRPRFLLDMKAE